MGYSRVFFAIILSVQLALASAWAEDQSHCVYPKSRFDAEDLIPSATELEKRLMELGFGHAQDRLNFDKAFPTYVEVCAGSKYTPSASQNDEIWGKPGNPWGHVAIYLKGVCRMDEDGVPQLQVCPPTADYNNPDTGVGVSVDDDFANARWVAIPSHSYFMRGRLRDNEPLSRRALYETFAQIKATGAYRGIALTPESVKDKPASMSYEDFAIRRGLGTDYALSFGRNVECSRIAVDKKSLAGMVMYLNSENRKAAKDGFRYDIATNNCAHLVRATLEAGGIPLPKEWDAKMIKNVATVSAAMSVAWMFGGFGPALTGLGLRSFEHTTIDNRAIPGNEMFKVLQIANRTEIESPDVVFKDPKKRAIFDQFQSLPYHNVAVGWHTRQETSKLFDRSPDVRTMENAALPSDPDFSAPHVEDAFYGLNLLDQKSRFERALKNLSAPLVYARKDRSLDSPEFAAFVAAYRKWLTESLERIQRQTTNWNAF